MKNQNFNILSIAIIFIFLAPNTAHMQNAKDIYKQRIRSYRADLQGAANVFFNKNLPDTQRINSIAVYGEFLNSENIEKAVATVQDEEESEYIRMTALAKVQGELARNPKFSDYVLGLLGNSSTPKALRTQSLSSIRVLGMWAMGKPGLSQKIDETMRQLASDEEMGYREVALSSLITKEDGYAQRLILEGLEDESKELLPKARAIRILGYNLKSDAYPVLHKIMLNPSNSIETRSESIKLLGGYPSAKDDIVNILQDNNQEVSLRLAAIGTLNANQPENFSQYALPILDDEASPVQLKVFGIRAEMNRRRVKSDRIAKLGNSVDEFDRAVQNLSNEGQPSQLKSIAEKYLREVSPDF